MAAPGDAEWGLLRAIEADFDADLPRLVYADWLEENGGEAGGVRARFIRWQCEQTRLGLDATPAKFAEYGQGVFGGMPNWLPKVPLIRGFPAPTVWGAADFVRGAGTFRAVAPLPPKLCIGGDDDIEFRLLFAVTHLEVVRSLALWSVTERMATAFAACRHLGALEHLEFSACHHSRMSAVALVAKSEPFRRLTGLTVQRASVFISSELAALLRSAPRLRHLRFGEHWPGDCAEAGDEWFAALAMGAYPRLRSLSLKRSLGEPATALANAVGLVKLHKLALGAPDFSDDDVRILLAAPHLLTVRRLEILGSAITDAGARLILADPRPWEAVNLAGSAVSPALLAELAERCAGRA